MASPSTSDAALVALLVLLLAAGAAERAVAVVVLVLDEKPGANRVTVNGYPPVREGYCEEGYCMVFVVPRAPAYTVSPACCSRAAGLKEGVNHAYWLGCVAVRTD